MLQTRPVNPNAPTPQECLRAAEILRKIAAYEPGGDTKPFADMARRLDRMADNVRVEVVRRPDLGGSRLRLPGE